MFCKCYYKLRMIEINIEFKQLLVDKYIAIELAELMYG